MFFISGYCNSFHRIFLFLSTLDLGKSCLELEENEIIVAASLGFDPFTKPHLRILANLKGNSFTYILLIKSE